LAGTAEHLPLPDVSVDLVVSSLSSHHWSDPAMAVRELRRVVRDGRRALIYDLRFVGLTDEELDTIATENGLQRAAITRRTLRGGLMRLFTQVTLVAQGAPIRR
jgi:ubiquinone/menaquinone biosynthesis C-methylase UbiE